MFTEDDLLPISALQHLVFCERQCALIHLERHWAENRLTVEGNILHERVHEEAGAEQRGDVRIVRGLRLHSLKLGVAGVSDVVEFRRALPGDPRACEVGLPGRRGRWFARPVEYKRGRPKADRCDEVQVAAHAMCLEEMMGGEIPEAELFYASTRRRRIVPVDNALRAFVESAAARLHELVVGGVTPSASYQKKCDNCSLVDACLPSIESKRRSVADYLAVGE